jgi:ribosomal protein S12 methylthiotransferase accessory factor
MPTKEEAAQIGVTRLARLTGLDRLGIEVVAAVRPSGHILQVTQGKGFTLASAQRSALGEAMELYAAEHPDERQFEWHRGTPHDAVEEGFEARCAWVWGQQLVSKKRGLVLAERIYCPKATGPALGPTLGLWSSNGLGAHPTSEAAACQHALCELIERDTLARVLPQGFEGSRLKRRLRPHTERMRALQVSGISLFLFDLSLHLNEFVTGVLIFDEEDATVPLTAGYACRPTFEASAEAAFLEAAQSRLTEIHGAREDVVHSAREPGLALLHQLRRFNMPTTGLVLRARKWSAVTRVVLRRKPWVVVKMVCPQMQVSELL